MKSSSVAVRFFQAFLPFLGGLLIIASAGTMRISGADEKKQAREEKWKTPPSAAGKPAAVEVRFTDNSLLKLKLDGAHLDFTRPHRKLFVAVAWDHRYIRASRSR